MSWRDEIASLGDLDRDVAASRAAAVTGPRRNTSSSSEMMDKLIATAVRARASDIHIGPAPDGGLIQYKINKRLVDVKKINTVTLETIINHLKARANASTQVTSLPARGQFTIVVDDHEVDMRLATLPLAGDETFLALRVLSGLDGPRKLDDMGMSSEQLVRFRRLVSRRAGLLLISGPPGSGKTNLLTATFLDMYTGTQNVITLEDPPEIRTPFRRMPINVGAGLVYHTALEGILVADPDWVMVGEIRDADTAQVAVRAAISSLLLGATVHAVDSAQAMRRLIDYGVHPTFAGDALMGVVAQRLIPRICNNCKEPVELGSEFRRLAGVELPDKRQFYAGRGCEACDQSGFSSLQGIFEIVPMTTKLRELVGGGASQARLREELETQKISSLKSEGLALVNNDVTTLDQLVQEGVLEP